jgi:hypothetical protein
MRRFTELMEEVQRQLAVVPGLAGLPRVPMEAGFAARSRLHYTAMLTVAPASAGARFLDLIRTRAGRRRAVERDATGYLERLLEVNTARIKNDFRDRLDASRRGREQQIRQHLGGLSATAERARGQARRAQAAGAAAVHARLALLSRLRAEVEALRPREV